MTRLRPSRPSLTLGEALLTPTRLYVKSALAAIRAGGVKGFAHITGGGITENHAARAARRDLDAEIDLAAWTPPPVFGWLAKSAGIARARDAAHLQLRHRPGGRGRREIRGPCDRRLSVECGDKARSASATLVPGDGEAKVRLHGSAQALMRGAHRHPDFRARQQSALADRGSRRSRISRRDRLVISNVEGAEGLAHAAAAAGIATKVIPHKSFASREAFDAALDAALREAGVEIVCLAGFMRILSDGFARDWEGRLINIHPSLLPAFKGMQVHERVHRGGRAHIGLHGAFRRARTGCRPDHRASRPCRCMPGDTPETLAARVLVEEHKLYPAALKMLAEGRVRLENG